jgi:hypothetical protein
MEYELLLFINMSAVCVVCSIVVYHFIAVPKEKID